jgi:hypothetical protein
MIIDVVDGTDPQLVNGEVADIREAGGDPIVMYGMSNAVASMVDQVILRAGATGTIDLLRLHGHGSAGSMYVAAGEEDQDRNLSSINVFTRGAGPSVRRLRAYFAPGGRAMLLGCEVASGRAGKLLIKSLADVWNVPVSAGSRTQYGGNAATTFRFEGPVYTAYPGGRMTRAPHGGVR